ncbi:hypothetical protein M426DRAFT_266083 [Hypoxylon sp. CI-4A]|nr:hypothetical protein M426DRAFT_266083 [Hypoxylon sp. CI-4A]
MARQKWVEVYDRETGGYKAYLDGNTTGEVEVSMPQKTQDASLVRSTTPEVTDRDGPLVNGNGSGLAAALDHISELASVDTAADKIKSITINEAHQPKPSVSSQNNVHSLDEDKIPSSGVENLGDAALAEAAGKDIRGELPERWWMEEDWNATPRDIKKKKASWDDWGGTVETEDVLDSGSSHSCSEYVKQFVEWWRESAAYGTVVNLFPEGVKEPEFCDVDTDTGKLMRHLDYPPTKRVTDVVRGLDSTSNTHINRAVRGYVQSKDAEGRILLRKKYSKMPGEDVDEVEQAQEVRVPNRFMRVNPANDREIRIPSHIRPAKEEDMEQVAAIYNREVNTSYKMPDLQPVGDDKFRQLYKDCVSQDIPFWVAVEGFHFRNTKNRVIGFAVMDTPRGIMGSYATHASTHGKLTIVIHEKFRRQNLCSAMLDAILYCCDPNYTARMGYEAVNPTHDRRYMRPEANPRRWYSIDIEIVLPSGVSKEEVRDTEEFEWISKYLKNYFNMNLIQHDEKLFKDTRFDSMNGGLWLDRLIFRHNCVHPEY